MKWSNVQLIIGREVRDQLRDRRTLFMIAVLPVLLYPLMGMLFLQITNFLREHPTRVKIVGTQSLPAEPELIDAEKRQFHARWCGPINPRLFELQIEASLPPHGSEAETRAWAEKQLESGEVQAVVVIPPDFGRRITRFRKRNEEGSSPLELAEVEVPHPQIFVDSARDKSRLAYDRLDRVLDRWKEEIVAQTLRENQVPIEATKPFSVKMQDVAQPERKQAAVWSKVLPFIVLVWALTGAFYPAIDLCAGEKERGTLETLLCSPAERSEIVWGKLITVMLFSIVTSLLNLASMGLTGTLILSQLAGIAGGTALQFGPPPVAAMGWLVLALIPVSALFSALSLAAATLARSTKEGQYYLMPLLLISLPLMVLPMLPTAELDLGTSLIPVSGVMLLLRQLMEGQLAEALPYAVPVTVVTVACVLLAIRWAIDQFNSETVLFRESERIDLGLWLQHVFRDRRDTPTVAMSLLCGVLILLIYFFARFAMVTGEGWVSLARVTVVTLIAFVATPAVIMAVMLTRDPQKTLLLKRPPLLSLVVAVLLAVGLHPLAIVFGEVIRTVYPMNEEVVRQLAERLKGLDEAPWWQVLLVIGLAPAICEELAYRGFILSGLRHLGHKWGAIAISSFFFALAHGFLQQSINAFFLGMVIGFIAVQTGSLLPCVLFHLTHNSLALLAGRIREWTHEHPSWQWVIVDTEGKSFVCAWPVVAVGGAIAIAALWWFRSLPAQASDEERLQHALDHQQTHAGTS